MFPFSRLRTLLHVKHFCHSGASFGDGIISEPKAIFVSTAKILLGRDFSVFSHRSSHKQNRQHVLLGNYNLVMYNIYIWYMIICVSISNIIYIVSWNILRYVSVYFPGFTDLDVIKDRNNNSQPQHLRRPAEESRPEIAVSTVVVGDFNMKYLWRVGDFNTFQSSILNKCF